MRLTISRSPVAANLACLVGAFWMAGCGGSHSSNNATLAGNTCTVNSECQEALVCTSGRCHAECVETRDCAYGQRCVKMGAASLCQLQVETKCAYNSDCSTPLICAVDLQCRAQCQTERDCTKGQVCTPTTHVCAETSEVSTTGELQVLSPPSSSDGGTDGGTTLDAAKDTAQTSDTIDAPASFGETGGTAGADGGKTDGGTGTDARTGTGGAGGGSGGGGGSCPTAQTQFGFIAKGDSNPNFKSGVGVRTASEMIIFNGYTGPDPSPNANANADADAGSATTYYIYGQAFNPATGESRGPAQPLFNAGPLVTGKNIVLQSASIAPTGEVLLLYTFCDGNYNWCYGVTAAFLGRSSADAGPGGLQLTRTVQAEVALLYGGITSYWSMASKSFVASWHYSDGVSAYPVKIRTFLVDGRSAKGDVDQVPTDIYDNSAQGTSQIGGAGNLVGVGYLNWRGWLPRLTVLDSSGNQVGSTIELQQSGVAKWITVAGTSAGFVALWDSSGVAASLIPIGSDGKLTGGGTNPDGGTTDGGTLPVFRFPGTTQAWYGRAINDDVGGVGGVGLLLAYSDRISFAYVGADGSSHVGPGSVFAHTTATGDCINISNSAGSFGLSLFSATDHSTQIAATICSP
jgi:hypothetical protein